MHQIEPIWLHLSGLAKSAEYDYQREHLGVEMADRPSIEEREKVSVMAQKASLYRKAADGLGIAVGLVPAPPQEPIEEMISYKKYKAINREVIAYRGAYVQLRNALYKIGTPEALEQIEKTLKYMQERGI